MSIIDIQIRRLQRKIADHRRQIAGWQRRLTHNLDPDTQTTLQIRIIQAQHAIQALQREIDRLTHIQTP